MEKHFEEFRKNVIGEKEEFETPYGKKNIHYFDWTASGRLYHPIEEKMKNVFGKYVANTHTESNMTGMTMTKAYHKALSMIKDHVGANEKDVIITEGTGVTGVINKLQRMLGLKIHETFKERVMISEKERPVVFITHMEHHSNHTSWLETICKVVVIPSNKEGNVDLEAFEQLLEKEKERTIKIGSFTACSNVTGIETPYHTLAKMMHENGGICIVDFAASAPYVEINMHPTDKMEKIDALVFSPHKFLGGPGTCGVLIFDSALYSNSVPDIPGGGTVNWTNPWGGKQYISNIEEREDGGTPGFLQAIRTALSIQLKEKMGMENMKAKKEILTSLLLEGLEPIPNLHILAKNATNRLGIVSFYSETIPYNMMVKILNDRYGIQVRGGCSCAGTYGHYLLNINQEKSKEITDLLNQGHADKKPGWVRISLHPIMNKDDIDYIIKAINEIQQNAEEIKKDYIRISNTNEYEHKKQQDITIDDWFKI